MAESHELIMALIGVDLTRAYARCPYLLQNGEEGRHGPNTCITGCWEEPTCVTGEPEGGWEADVPVQLAEVAYHARLDAGEARGRHGAVKHARDIARWAEKRLLV